MDDQMDAGRSDRCAAWLERLGEWCGSERRAGIACEVVRGIVGVDEPEWAAAVAWAGGAPTHADWVRALVLYGPSLTGWGDAGVERSERAHQCIVAAAHRSQRTMRNAVRA